MEQAGSGPELESPEYVEEVGCETELKYSYTRQDARLIQDVKEGKARVHEKLEVNIIS